MRNTPHTSITSHRRLLIVIAVAGSFATSAAPALAADCPANANGIAHSHGAAAGAATTACPPAWGRSGSSDTGRKVG